MKAVIRTRYGPPRVLQLADVEKPVPADNQVLLKVHAASLNKADLYDIHPPFMVRMVMGGGRIKPKVASLGRDLAGRVESVGKDVTRFKPGDEVFGVGPGAFAEYAVAREDRLTSKPAGLSFEDCAAMPVAGLTALQGLRKAKVDAGQRILVDGGSGGVGLFVLQMAKSVGAEVTAVCSTQHLDDARLMGADHTIDYTKEDFTKNDQRYDVIIGVNGFHSVFAIQRALAPKGTFVMLGSSKALSGIAQVALLGRLASRSGKNVGFMGIAKIVSEDLATLAEMMQEGKLRAMIDGRYPLAQASDAFEYFARGHAHGKVIVSVAPD